MVKPTSVRRRLSRPQPFHIILLGALLAGCSAPGGLGASPAPTDTPAPTRSEQPIGSQSSKPSTSPTTVPTDGVLVHPAGATDVVLRMFWGGGFVPPQITVSDVPQFTLFGDGTAVFKPLTPIEGTPFNQPLPPMLTVKLTEDEVQTLLEFALNDGHLAVAKESYTDPMIADAGSTTFSIDAGGYDKTVNVYALMESTSSGPETEDRNAMFKLQDRLNNFATEALGGNVKPYDPSAYRVTLFDQGYGQPNVEPIPWPWTDVTLGDFVKGDEAAWPMMVMTRDQVGKLTIVPNGGQTGIFVMAPDTSGAATDGVPVELVVRPLLPDEIAPAS